MGERFDLDIDFAYTVSKGYDEVLKAHECVKGDPITPVFAITNKSQVTLEDEQEAKDIIIKANDVLQTKINILNK